MKENKRGRKNTQKTCHTCGDLDRHIAWIYLNESNYEVPFLTVNGFLMVI